MDQQDIQKIEQVLRIKLPLDYCNHLLAYPDGIDEAKVLHFSTEATWLIGQNEWMRENPANFFGKTSWPAHYFIIGEDGNGNAFYLDLRQPQPSPVYFLNHEAPEQDGQQTAASFEEWIPQVRTALEQYRKNARLLQANQNKRKVQKPWWQFW